MAKDGYSFLLDFAACQRACSVLAAIGGGLGDPFKRALPASIRTLQAGPNVHKISQNLEASCFCPNGKSIDVRKYLNRRTL